MAKSSKKQRQQSIQNFDADEQSIVDAAMRIEHIQSQAQWVRRASVLWGRQVIDGQNNSDVLEAIRAAERSLSNQIDDLRKDIKAD